MILFNQFALLCILKTMVKETKEQRNYFYSSLVQYSICDEMEIMMMMIEKWTLDWLLNKAYIH
jgi:hypothetical protein